MDKRQNPREFWKSHFEEHKTTGLSQKAYCRQQNISYWSFNSWKRKLEKQNGSQFQEISAVFVRQALNNRKPFEIVVNDKIRLIVPDEFSVLSLEKILRVLSATNEN